MAAAALRSRAAARFLRRMAVFLVMTPVLAALSRTEQKAERAALVSGASGAAAASRKDLRRVLIFDLVWTLRFRAFSEVLTRLMALLMLGMDDLLIDSRCL